jgi:2-dehydro-3-deoxygluconokinase
VERKLASMIRVASVGECMIELSQAGDGLLQRSWGGDTLNTAVYLARLGVPVDYFTALGDDPLSDEMVAAWRAEGVGTDRVVRVPGRLPGLYLISTDAAGQRRFDYWRDSAPARLLFDLPETGDTVAALAGYDLVYVSGISLALYGDAGRERLFGALDETRARGGRVAFDTNFRARLWPDRAQGQAAYRAAIKRASTIMASIDDLDQLFGSGERCQTPGLDSGAEPRRPGQGSDPVYGSTGLAELQTADSEVEIVLKLAEPGVRIFHRGAELTVPAPRVTNVIDTTAAGDSFAAAYLAARLAGADQGTAARCGHCLAGAVVQHRGAIIPRSAMPEGCHVAAKPAGPGRAP